MIKKPEKLHFKLLKIAFALAIAFIVSEFRFDYLEGFFYDVRVRFKPAPEPSGHIELIAIEPSTIEQLGRSPNANDHTQALRKLREAGAKSVVYLISPNDIVGSFDELSGLADEMATTPMFFAGVQELALKGQENAYTLLPPFEKITPASVLHTVDRGIFAGDNVTRRLMVSYQGEQVLHPILAKLFNPAIEDEKNIRGLFEYLGSNQTYIDFRPAGTYPLRRFVDVMNGQIDTSIFKDKVVFIGRDTNSTSKDYVLTPYSRDVVAMTVLELNANILDTLIQNSAPIRTPPWVELALTGLIAILIVYVVLTSRPTEGLLILAGTIATYFLLCYFAFWWTGVWIGVAQPFLAIFVCYYFFIPYRLIVENRRSWEYFQKNRLLTQVEELKTNFLSMMSHDLKTPIARIQGMTDLVLKDANPLSAKQIEALETLRKSSDELLEFVSSILNLGRIESKELKLHMKSRDPNSLLSEVISKYNYMAKTKEIEITTELEPMFSLKMDTDLMRQVFSNLLENAIKYSPEGSRVLVSSEESDGKVVIQIADQGMGIPEDELPHVFTKFYRSKDAKTSTIKGSGLGLYLAKYFVELHKGTVSVDSRPGEGSTFTVELPMDSQLEQTGA